MHVFHPPRPAGHSGPVQATEAALVGKSGHSSWKLRGAVRSSFQRTRCSEGLSSEDFQCPGLPPHPEPCRSRRHGEGAVSGMDRRALHQAGALGTALRLPEAPTSPPCPRQRQEQGDQRRKAHLPAASGNTCTVTNVSTKLS